MPNSRPPAGKSDDFSPPGLNKGSAAPDAHGNQSANGHRGLGGLADDANQRPEHPDGGSTDHEHGGPGTGTMPDTPPEPPEPPEPPTLTEFVDQFFATFDADGDASITVEEMLAVLDPDAAHPGFDKHVGKVIAAVDADGDAALSPAELEAVLMRLDAEHHGKPDAPPGRLHAATVQLVNLALKVDDSLPDPPPPPPPPPPTLTEFLDALFERFDADADATITLDEMLAALDPAAAHPGFDKHVGKVFAALDADQDLGLSRDELETALARLDADQHGQPEDVPGRMHAATVQLVGLALTPDDAPGHGD